MADKRRLRIVIEWDDDGAPDYDEDGNMGGYMKFMDELDQLGVKIVHEETIPMKETP